MRKFTKLLALLATVLLMTVALVACGGNDKQGDAEKQAADNKGTVKLGYVEWDSEVASTHVVKEVLESKMGYEVEATAVDAAIMWQGIKRGDFDAIVSAWLPATHADYYAQVEGDVENLGPNLEDAKIGLVVPSYVEINSIEELNSVKDQFEGKIVGIEPGAGVVNATEKAIAEYGLDFNLQTSSSAAMAAELTSAIKEERAIAVTGWTPHWKFAKFDLKYLEDPKGVYGEAEQIDTIVRKGLKDDDEELYNFLDKFYWTPADMEAVMLKIQDGMDPEEAAKQWVEENKDKVEEWLN
ncbi:glycine betaine ABC transporter substrate-binding protein [Peptococcaceae bacterium 1198_IL3148]